MPIICGRSRKTVERLKATVKAALVEDARRLGRETLMDRFRAEAEAFKEFANCIRVYPALVILGIMMLEETFAEDKPEDLKDEAVCNRIEAELAKEI